MFVLNPGNAKSRCEMVIFGLLFLPLLDDDEHEWIIRTCRKAEDEKTGHKPKPRKWVLLDNNNPKQVI